MAGDLWGGEKPLGQYIQLGLQAYLMQRDIDYLVRDGRIVLLNQNTGRTLDSSRWSHGVQQVRWHSPLIAMLCARGAVNIPC